MELLRSRGFLTGIEGGNRFRLVGLTARGPVNTRDRSRTPSRSRDQPRSRRRPMNRAATSGLTPILENRATGHAPVDPPDTAHGPVVESGDVTSADLDELSDFMATGQFRPIPKSADRPARGRIGRAAANMSTEVMAASDSEDGDLDPDMPLLVDVQNDRLLGLGQLRRRAEGAMSRVYVFEREADLTQAADDEGGSPKGQE